MDSLNEDCLGHLFRCFEPKLRVTQVSLVCKTWQKVEREYPHRPVQLYMKPADINSAFLTWHLRDTSKLEEVKVLYDRDDILISEGYWEGILQLLNHLSDKAPALCNLDLVPPRLASGALNTAQHHPHLAPLVGALSRLESLALKEWEYSLEDIPLITHLTRLQNLKMLELSQVRPGNGNVKDEVLEEASLQFQETFRALGQLTSLHLSNVDSILVLHVLPAEDVGSLTHLRSLTYHFDSRWLGHFWPTFPEIAEMVGLTHLHVACCEEEAISLESLHNLRELTLTNFTLLQELVVSSAAELTKLSVQCGMGDAWDRVLSVKILQSVRDLNLDCYQYHLGEPAWPTTWSELTNLTRLAIHCKSAIRYHGQYCFPEFLTGLRSLRDVESTTEISDFNSSGDDQLILLATCLTQLTRLQINIAGSVVPELWWGKIGKVEQTCQSVSHRVPGMLYSLTDVDPLDESQKGRSRLLFTLER